MKNAILHKIGSGIYEQFSCGQLICSINTKNDIQSIQIHGIDETVSLT